MENYEILRKQFEEVRDEILVLLSKNVYEVKEMHKLHMLRNDLLHILVEAEAFSVADGEDYTFASMLMISKPILDSVESRLACLNYYRIVVPYDDYEDENIL